MGIGRQELRSQNRIESLRTSLHQAFEKYESETYVESDPLRYVYRFKDARDQELVGFLSALFAFGGVKAIFLTLDRFLEILGPTPYQSLLSGKIRSEAWKALYHRWITGRDIAALMRVLQEILSEFGTLEAFFGGEGSLQERIESFSLRFNQKLGRFSRPTIGLKFLFPRPSQGSACKRMNLFLRWMVRSERPDLGIWKNVSASELFIPLDTHLHRISTYLGFTERKGANWRSVMEVTQCLRLIFPEDPIRFDFALSRLGILRDCKHHFEASVCGVCPLNKHCNLALDEDNAMSYEAFEVGTGVSQVAGMPQRKAKKTL